MAADVKIILVVSVHIDKTAFGKSYLYGFENIFK